MTERLFLDGKNFITVADAIVRSGYVHNHITRLCREGKLEGKKVGATWYVGEDSLEEFLTRPETLVEDGKRYILAAEAAKTVGYARDYVLELCREKRIDAKKVDDSWMVEENAIKHFFLEQQRVRLVRDSVLAKERREARVQSASDQTRSTLRSSAVIAVAPKALSHYLPHRKSNPHVKSAAVLAVVMCMLVGGYQITDAYRSGTLAMPTFPVADELLASAASTETRVADAVTPLWSFFGSLFSRTLLSAQDLAGAYFGTSTMTHQQGAVSVKITASPTVVAPNSPSLTNTSFGVPITQTVINQPVIERIRESVKTISTGGITPELLAAALEQLDNKLSSQIANVTASGNATYQVVAQTNRIDQLTGVDIYSSTVHGLDGLTDADIPDGITASNYVLLTGGSISGTLTTSDLIATNATSTNATSTNFFATSFNGTNATTTTLALTGLTSSLLKTDTLGRLIAAIPGTDYQNFGYTFPGNATTTLLSFIGGASSTALSANTAAFGGTGTTSISSSGSLTIQSLTGPLQAINGLVSATSTLSSVFGGTGMSTYTLGDTLYADGADHLAVIPVGGEGTVLKISGGIPTWGTDLTGSGGSGGGTFSTTTSSVSGQLINYSTNSTDIVTIGGSGTTSAKFWFDPNKLVAYFGSNVGIGTTSPGQKLSVAGNILGNTIIGTSFTATSTTLASTFPYASTTAISSTNASSSNLIASNSFTLGSITGFLKATAGSVATALIDLTSDITGILAATHGGTGWAAIQSGSVLYGNGASALATSSAFTFDGTKLIATYASSTSFTASGSVYLATSGGNVGIGTTTPATKLDIFGTSGLPSLSLDGSANYNGLSFKVNSTQYAKLIQESTGSLYYDVNNHIFRSLAGTEYMRINSSGNVGIGTTTPFTKLEVNDEIISGAVKTTGGNLRMISGNYGSFLRNDGSSTYLLLTASGDQYGTWNTLRPFSVNDSTGAVSINTAGSGATTIGNASSVLTINSTTLTYSSATKNVIPNNTASAWTIATSSTATPLVQIDTTTGSELVTIGKRGGSVQIGDSTTPTNLVFGGSSTISGSGLYTLTFGTTGDVIQYGVGIKPSTTNVFNLGASGSNWGCLYYNNSTLGTCASDERLKTGITDLSFDTATSSALDQLTGLRLRSFAYKSAPTSIYDGLIAQEVQAVAPELVVEDASTTMLAVKYGDIQWLTVAALQQLNAKFNALLGNASSTDQTVDTPPFFSRLLQWFASATNGIGDFFANRVHTKELCVTKTDGTDVCVSGDQLAAVLAGQSASAPVSVSAGAAVSAGSASPVITVLGLNPAHIAVGSSYSDLGATVTDDKDINLGIYISVDGGATTTQGLVSVDTTVAGTHTILYRATDNDGNTTTATRQVIVGTNNSGEGASGTTTPSGSISSGASATTTPAVSTSTPIVDTATSTDSTSLNTSGQTVAPQVATSTTP